MYIKIVHTHPVELYRVTNSAPFSSDSNGTLLCIIASDALERNRTRYHFV